MAEEGLERIIAGCKNGDEKSFPELVNLYARRIYGYFYRLTGNRTVSDDFLSELFVKLVERIGSYRGGGFNWKVILSKLWGQPYMEKIRYE